MILPKMMLNDIQHFFGMWSIDNFHETKSTQNIFKCIEQFHEQAPLTNSHLLNRLYCQVSPQFKCNFTPTINRQITLLS